MRQLVELASSSTRTSNLSNNLRPESVSADEKMWSNTSFDYLRRLCSNIKLRRRRSPRFLYGPGEASTEKEEERKGRSCLLQGRNRRFQRQSWPRITPEELHIGTHGLEWNDQVERLSEFTMTTKTIHGNSQFQKPSFVTVMK
ncbi:hypothetical protein NECAME_12773 [Necator americanus]|uniref:Uncharacterized protein n=1 Tax=Necator americanus TaxID=51031 RepID=W2T0F2_NECAM|nr:hypothetical protein NECAME_12773 [Necator americanus]ETN74726.1 hypothetical protein NECAME_12773 [Necator americanus]